jgi:hypothetical protein
VEAATGPDGDLDRDIVRLLGSIGPNGAPYCAGILGIADFTASLDAVLALVGEKLPGWHVVSLWDAPGHGWSARLSERKPSSFTPTDRIGAGANYKQAEAMFRATPSIALLSALLAALDASGWHGQGPMSTTDDCRASGTNTK